MSAQLLAARDTNRKRIRAMEEKRTELNPNDEQPIIDISPVVPPCTVVRGGLHNNHGFTWDEEGHPLSAENSPDADAPEELNLLEQGKHYGFPYQFSDWAKKLYPHTPDATAGLVITNSFRNLGPDGAGNARGLSTLGPHSSPASLVWVGVDWAAPFSSSFLVMRFGNLLKRDPDTGFDILQLRPKLTSVLGINKIALTFMPPAKEAPSK